MKLFKAATTAKQMIYTQQHERFRDWGCEKRGRTRPSLPDSFSLTIGRAGTSQGTNFQCISVVLRPRILFFFYGFTVFSTRGVVTGG